MRSPSSEPLSRDSYQPECQRSSSGKETSTAKFNQAESESFTGTGGDIRTRRQNIDLIRPGSREKENNWDEHFTRSSRRSSKSKERASRQERFLLQLDEGGSTSSESDISEVISPYSNGRRSRGSRNPSMLEEFWQGPDSETLNEDAEVVNKEGEGRSGEMNWFWACQIDVIPGYLATPWTDKFSIPHCFGAVAVIIESLGVLTGYSQPVYLNSKCHERGLVWIQSGRATFPPYGVSASDHHGTVISGAYSTTSFPGFRAPLFPIELLCDYRFQVDRHLSSNVSTLRARLSELMAIDAWLSYCGRQPEICGHGSGNELDLPVLGLGDLLYTTPTLVQRTMDSFKFEFANLERTAFDGGLQLVRQIALNLLDTLGWKVEGLAPGEKLFVLVAILRAAKMALCIASGTDTSALREILLNDVQVHLV
jgi:hypothetical protein